MCRDPVSDIKNFDIPNPFKPRCLYDFEICADYDELKATLKSINHCGYQLVSVTQDHRGFYTVFFRRCAGG